jgi:hypothetical protein
MKDRKFTVALRAISLVGILHVALSAQGYYKPRVYIEQSDSWEVDNGGSGSIGILDSWTGGGARPQTAEIIKTFKQRCPSVIVTTNKDRADYVVVWEHEGGKSPVIKDNKYAVFDSEGDAIASGSTRSLGNAVKDACAEIKRDLRYR